MDDNNVLVRLEDKIDDLNYKITKNKIVELSEIIGDWRKLLWRNFISGIVKGIGFSIGFSIVTAIIVVILNRIITLNIPVISQYIADIVEIVEMKR